MREKRTDRGISKKANERIICCSKLNSLNDIRDTGYTSEINRCKRLHASGVEYKPKVPCRILGGRIEDMLQAANNSRMGASSRQSDHIRVRAQWGSLGRTKTLCNSAR